MFDDEYAKYYDLFNSTKPYKKEINFVYRWADKPKSIFDIGCGTANYWKYYPAGTDLFGVEKSEAMINAAKEKMVVYGDITAYKIKCPAFDCATALFNVINYIPDHKWWKNIPINKGGYFIFDIWDKQKVVESGFRTTFKMKNGVSRTISPIGYSVVANKAVVLKIEIVKENVIYKENHEMFIHSYADIKKFCGRHFKIVEVKPTETWRTWYKLQRK